MAEMTLMVIIREIYCINANNYNPIYSLKIVFSMLVISIMNSLASNYVLIITQFQSLNNTLTRAIAVC